LFIKCIKFVNYNILKYLFLILILIITSVTVFSQDDDDDDGDEFTEKRLEVNDVEFEFKKTETFGSGILKDAVILPKRTAFRVEDLEQDRLRLEKFYFDNGFFDAVIDTATMIDNEDETVDVRFIIIENSRYRYENISYKNLDSIPEDLKKKLFIEPVIKKGGFYSKGGIVAEITRIIDFLQDNGYPFAMQDTADGIIVEKYTNATKVNVELSFFDVNKQYYIGETRIQINNNKYGFDPELIRREINYKEGVLYRKSVILQSERNFSKFAILQGGRIQIDTTLEESNRVNLVANVTLGNKYEITPNIVGVNIHPRFYLGAGVQYLDKNFFGGGRTLTIQLQGLASSKDANRVELSTTLFQPYFIRNSITATYNLSAGFYNIDEKRQILSIRNLFRFNYFIADYTFYNNAFSDITIDLLRIKYKKDDYDIIDEDTTFHPSGELSNVMNSIIGLTLVHDNTNDLYNPSRGFTHSITVEDAGLIPRLIDLLSQKIEYPQYVKFFIPNRAYFDISGGRATSVLAVKFDIGDIIEYGRDENIVPVPIIYRFFSGGSNSIRGWRAQTNGILADPEDGGLFLLEGSLEYRWQTFADNEGFLKNLSTAYFIDYGNVWRNHKVIRFDEIALAIGFGVRYNTFVGPLRIDFGWRLFDPSARDGNNWLFDDAIQIFKGNKFAVQFGIGQAF
jgi:outer membrane protein assembly factor BamA